MKTWVKWYTEILDDADIGTLSWAERGVFSALCALAGKLDLRDENDMETGELDTITRVAWHLRCSVAEIQPAIDACMQRGFVHERDGVLFVTHYPDRQAHSPSEDREAVAARVRQHRAQKKQACNEGVTPLQADGNECVTQLEKKRVEKNRPDKKREGAAPLSPLSPESPDRDVVRALYVAYQRGMGWTETMVSLPDSELPALRKLAGDGIVPSDVELCTRWLRTMEFWSCRTPPVATIHKNLSEWVRQGRPEQAPERDVGGNGGKKHGRTDYWDTPEGKAALKAGREADRLAGWGTAAEG